ncbi:MAG: glycosyltransferase [Planctomycetes bacterium]|nr:glycosyltransferase [Planctomycetota bacterium]
MFLHVLFVLAGLLWWRVTITVLRGSAALRDLEAWPPDTGPRTERVTAIVAVRDGQDELGATLDGLLAQQHVSLQVIAVDDRSSDGTPALLATRARAEPRLAVVRVDVLEDGWLGKPHACALGARAASDADWLLFVDADTRLAPDALARALRAAESDGVPHLCLVPRLDGQTAPGRAVGIVFCLGLFERALDVARGSRRRTMGVGAFTLIRREVYEAIGGHSALRMHVVEDMALAQRVRAAGHRSGLRLAIDAFGVHWVTDLASAFGVLRKNYFALFRYRVDFVLLASAAFLALWVAGVLGVAHGGWSGYLASSGLASLVIAAAAIAGRYRLPRPLALLTPLLLPIVPLSLLHSTFVTLRDGGVRWRDTFYPLERLRRGS